MSAWPIVSGVALCASSRARSSSTCVRARSSAACSCRMAFWNASPATCAMTSSMRTSSRSKRPSPSPASTSGTHGCMLAHERRGQERRAGQVDEQRLAALHRLQRARPQFVERGALARARGGDRRHPHVVAHACPDRSAIVRQRLAQDAEQRARDIGRSLRRRERARERLQVPHLLEGAARACRHRGRAAGDQALVRKRDAILAQALGLVERRVGGLQQVTQVAAVAGPAGDAERQRQPPAAQVDAGEAALQAPADGTRIGLRGLGQQQRELLAADAEDAVGRSHAPPQERADVAQRIVAGHVPARVVELLEVVDVGQDEGEARRARGHEPAHRLVEAAVVGEPGEGVRRGLRLLALEGPQALEGNGRMRHQQGRVVDQVGRQRRAAAVAGEVAVRARRRAQRQAEPTAFELDAALVAARRRERGQRCVVECVLARALVAQPGLRQHQLAFDGLADLHAGEPQRAPDRARDDAQHRAVLARLCEAGEGLPQPACPAGCPVSGGSPPSASMSIAAALCNRRRAPRRPRPRRARPRRPAAGRRRPVRRHARGARRSSPGRAARTGRARRRAAPTPRPAPRDGDAGART